MFVDVPNIFSQIRNAKQATSLFLFPKKGSEGRKNVYFVHTMEFEILRNLDFVYLVVASTRLKVLCASVVLRIGCAG